ncbi:MAG: hypothetical protein AABY00_02330 [Nanoarchaeota archaeon]
MRNKQGQLAVIIIIAVVLVAVIILYFTFRSDKNIESISAELAPVYDYYAACMEQEARAGVDLAGTQGGYVFLPEYLPGSEYAPFSSQLNFLGFGVPYWYYVSNNGLVKEQVPSRLNIEKELADFISQRLFDCDFESFAREGVSVRAEAPRVTVILEDREVSVRVDAEVAASKGEQSARKTRHDVTLSSSLGSMYESAKKIYTIEKEKAFLETYAEDVLRLYAPVDGVEVSCSPKIWKVRDVEETLKKALEQNIASIRTQESASKKGKDYFYTDLGARSEFSDVSFAYASRWPTKIEITGTQGELMIAQPVGNAQGMGAMGFCYAPYHFVYDLSFPVMTQITSENGEVFQFPVVVVIDNNLPRQGLSVGFGEESTSSNLCTFVTQDIEVTTYDSHLKKIDSNVSYSCFDQECPLGQTSGGVLRTKAPACLNGELRAQAEGYSDKELTYSSSKEGRAELILDRTYETPLFVTVDGKPLLGNAVVSFTGRESATGVFPESSSLLLSEGLYNVSVYVYGNSSIVIAASTKKECTQVSSGGILGLFGSTKEQCFDLTLPETRIDSALIGGGTSEVYLLPEMLSSGLKVDVQGFAKPTSLQQLQTNYELFEQSGVSVS